MDIMTGIVIIVAIIAVTAFLALLTVVSDRVDTPEPRPRPTVPMWTSVTTYGPSCAVVRLEGDDAVKVCVREANHDGDHHYKVINLHTQETRDDVL